MESLTAQIPSQLCFLKYNHLPKGQWANPLCRGCSALGKDLPCVYWSTFLSPTLLNRVLMNYFSRLCGHVRAAYSLPKGGSQDENRAYLHWWR